MHRNFLCGVVALAALCIPALADEKGDALLAEVEARAKTIRTFSAKLSLNISGKGVPTQNMSGRLVIQRPQKTRFELQMPQGAMAILADGKATYQVTGKKYTKLPPEAKLDSVWPPLFGKVGDFVGGAQDAKYITQKIVGDQALDVVDVTGPAGTVRAYINRDSLVERVRLTMKDAPIVQEMSLSEIAVDEPLKESEFQLPEGAEEEKGGGGGDLDKKLVPVGKAAPAFSLATPTGGTLSLAQAIKGKKATLINFWFYG